ncbi:imelysin family protein [Leptospira sp. 201903070]|uniref:Imelysin family protein n=1 Tax=Leptospira ainlahdjerensis TaxID=2810033 RepID=A0ABS2UHY5_9LEPT|nr:imelysin family protein [Leptospira ainlahdjerensis]MBM9579203.1 imelysin family protein [Leptospira ainlahdjerensis]
MKTLEFSNKLKKTALIANKIKILLLTSLVVFPGIRCEEIGKISGVETLIIALFANASTGEFLNYSANQVAVPQFNRLQIASNQLKTSAANYFTTAGTGTGPTDLADLQNKWLAARKLFKQAEIFYINRSYLPSTYVHRLDGYVLGENSRPTTADLDAVAATAPSSSTVDSFPLTRRGFAALEYFIFDNGANVHTLAAIDNANGLSAGRRTYIASLATVIQLDSQRLYNAWNSSFANELATGSGSFTGTKDAVDSFINGIVQLEYTNQDVRIGVPAGLTLAGSTQFPAKLESVYSDTSYQDLLSSVEGLELVYAGNVGDTDSRSLSYLVRLQNSDLDTRVRSKINTLKSNIQSRINASITLKTDLTGNLTFVSTQIHSNFKELRTIFATEVIGILGANALPSNSDGD